MLLTSLVTNLLLSNLSLINKISRSYRTIMAEPRTNSEQIRAKVFPVDKRIALYFETSEFNKVWQIKKEDKKDVKIVPKMSNLGSHCRNDIKIMKKVLTRFKFTEQENIISLEGNPSFQKVKKAVTDLKGLIRNNPDLNFVIFAILAGHGMVDQGSQVVLLNEYYPSSKFYRFWNAENDFRYIADKNSNSYVVCCFACCREVFNPIVHAGCFASQEDALLHQEQTEEALRRERMKEALQKNMLTELNEFRRQLTEIQEAQKVKENEAEIELKGDEEDKDSDDDNRGGGDRTKGTRKNQNFFFILPCRPGLGVKADTKMVKEISNRMIRRYNRHTFMLTIPSMFDDMIGADVQFEMIASQTLQQLKLEHEYNNVTKSTAIIFVCPHPKSDGVMKSELAVLLFKDELKFQTVKLYYNLAASQMEEKLDLLQCEVDSFEKKSRPSDLNLIAIIAIGAGLKPETDNMDLYALKEQCGWSPPQINRDATEYYKQFMYDSGLLHVFNLIERGSRFANSPSTHVVNLEDLNCEFDPEDDVNEREEDDPVLEVDEDDNVLEVDEEDNVRDDDKEADCAKDSDDQPTVINERCVRDEYFVLQERPGRRRQAVGTSIVIEKLYKSIKENVRHSGQKAIQIPFVFNDNGGILHMWPDSEQEQCMLPIIKSTQTMAIYEAILRQTKMNQQTLALYRPDKSLKKSNNYWKEKADLLHQKNSKGIFSPSIHHLGEVIVHITGGPDDTEIDNHLNRKHPTVLFVLHDKQPPYKELNSIEVLKQDFDYGMVIPNMVIPNMKIQNTKQQVPISYTYTAVLCTTCGSYEPVKLLKLTHFKDIKEHRKQAKLKSVIPEFPGIDKEKKQTVEELFHLKQFLQYCTLNQDMIILCTQDYLLIYNKDLEKKYQEQHQISINSNVEDLLYCQMDTTHRKESKQTIFVSFSVKEGKEGAEFSNKFKSLQPDHAHEIPSISKTIVRNWFVECKLDLSNPNNKKPKFVYDPKFSKSFMLTTHNNDPIESFVQTNTVAQFLLQRRDSTELIVIENWQFKQKVNVSGQFTLYQGNVFPDFNLDSFPLLISQATTSSTVSLSTSYDLINCNTGSLQPLIKATAYNHYNQHATFFKKRGSNKIEFHFCRVRRADNEFKHGWCRLVINKDLLDILKEYGQLPTTSIKESLNAMKQLKEHNQAIEEYKTNLKHFSECTFITQKGKDNDQDAYQCKTCKLVKDKGICKACLETCHKGEDHVTDKHTGIKGIDDDTIVDGDPWSFWRMTAMKWSETTFQKKCKASNLSQDERRTLRRLIAEQRKRRSMRSLIPYPHDCSCHTVKCKFQDPNFFIDKVSGLIEEKKVMTFESNNLKEVQRKLKQLSAQLGTPPSSSCTERNDESSSSSSSSSPLSTYGILDNYTIDQDDFQERMEQLQKKLDQKTQQLDNKNHEFEEMKEKTVLAISEILDSTYGKPKIAQPKLQ